MQHLQHSIRQISYALVLWIAQLVEYIFPLVAGWVNVGMAITNFVLFSLHAAGTVRLSEAYFPYCTVLIDAKSTGAITWR